MAKTEAGIGQHNRQSPADEFMADLDHPLKSEIELVRRAVLSVDPSITDGVKWNSLSFRTAEWFCTVNLRCRSDLQLVMHLGAKTGAAAGEIDDPNGLLKWLGQDRALATLGSGPEATAAMPAFKSIVRKWISRIGLT